MSRTTASGFKVRIRKLDPYLNVDPGTMSPYQHGEVYVTDDGAETDLDLGHYERFTGVSARQSDNITSGRIYRDIITKERKGAYLGATVQVIPHVTDAIKEFALEDSEDLDFILHFASPASPIDYLKLPIQTLKVGSLGTHKALGLAKETLAVGDTRGISKADMVMNDACPEIEVNPETYEVRADGELLTCAPATELPMAQRYFLF